MSTFITDDCINCNACLDECPNGAITDGSDVGKDIYHIHPNLCTECVGESSTEQCQLACPVACCLPDPEIRESEEVLAQRALALHPNDHELHTRIASGNFLSLFRK